MLSLGLLLAATSLVNDVEPAK